MCSETDITEEKVNFHATTGIPNSSSYCRCPSDDHLQEGGFFGSSFARGRPLILTTTKGAWKMHFWDSSQWDKMGFECQRIKWKKDKNFHICLRSGPRWLTPPARPFPPYGQPNCKIFVFFWRLPLSSISKFTFKMHCNIIYVTAEHYLEWNAMGFPLDLFVRRLDCRFLIAINIKTNFGSYQVFRY